ncbi:MAG: glycosyltransferase family 4 protein [Thermoanaerobaculia bacterium]|nr:glycosyltransferase family 4 protein [Thermoanaerobaculia bacterium]
MDVLILSHYYDPEPIPKAGELARALTQRGHSLSVITGFPNYPTGKLYDGWHLSLVSRRRDDGGFPVVRTFQYPYHGRSVLGRLANYLSFMATAPLGALFTSRCDVIYVWHPPLTIGIAAWLIARLKHAPFIYDVQDIWPESALLSGMLRDGLLVRIISRVERFVYSKADHLICVTEGARQNLIGKGVDPEKLTVLPHWVDEREFVLPDRAAARARVREQFGWGTKFVLMFAGNIGLVQGLETVIEAAQLLAEEENLLVAIVGDGSDRERLIGLVREKNVAAVQFVDRQPSSSMPALMAGADALLVHLRNSQISNWVVPSKTMAYLASGKPIVMAMEGAAADLTREAGAGVVVPPENARALAEALRELARMSEEERDAMGRRGREYLERNLSKQVVIDRYEQLLHLVASRGR